MADTSDVSLLLIGASGTALSGKLGSSDKLMAIIQTNSLGEIGLLGNSDKRLYRIGATGAAITDGAGTSDLTRLRITASGVGITATLASSDQALPTITAEGSAHTDNSGYSDEVLQLIIASGHAYQLQPGDVVTPENPYNEPQEAWVINYETNAPYRYFRYPANAMCRFKGRMYVSNPAGIYEVTGESDQGAKIHQQITLPKSGFGESRNKRIPYVYLGVRCRGMLNLKVVANADACRYYALNSGPDYMRGSRADIGKGLNAQYWQFAVANKDGAYFELDSVEFPPVVLSRHGV